MTDRDCADVRAGLAAGERLGGRLTRHLESCADCHEEAERLGRVLQLLQADASIDPPATLDQRVRAWIGSTRPTPRPVIRPFLAAGLGAASFIALIAGTAGLMAQAGAAEYGPTLAVLLGGVYLAISSAATLPLLVRMRPNRSLGEVSQ